MSPIRTLALAAILLMPAPAFAQQALRNLEADVANYKLQQAAAQGEATQAPALLTQQPANQQITAQLPARMPEPAPQMNTQANAAPESLGLMEPAAGESATAGVVPLAPFVVRPNTAPEVYVRRSDGKIIPAVTAPAETSTSW